MYKIFIIMFLFTPDPEGFDSLTINTDNGMPLRFETTEECGEYIHKYLVMIQIKNMDIKVFK